VSELSRIGVTWRPDAFNLLNSRDAGKRGPALVTASTCK
jgi:hypothetical protein